MTLERFVKQLAPCAFCSGGKNCTCACHAMWMYRASQGRVAMSACAVRTETGDKIGGTNLHQMASISAKHLVKGGVLWLPGSFAKARDLVMTGRYGLHINIGYNPLANTQWDCFDGGFRGAHDEYISAGDANHARVGDPGADGRRAGIPKSWQLMPWDLLERAAGALPLSENGPTLAQEHGSGSVFAYLTPADPIPPTQVWRVVISGYTPLYTLPNGIKLAHGVSAATFVCTRAKVNGLWWYRITGPDRSKNVGRYFKPNGHMEAHFA